MSIRVSPDVQQIAATAASAGVGMLNTLQIIQTSIGIVAGLLSIASMYLILRKNAGRGKRNEAK